MKLSSMKVYQNWKSIGENYFNGDAKTGNNEVKVYKAIEKGDFTITECFKDETEVRDNFNELWKIVSNYNKYLALRSPTKNQVEEAALECEKFCKLFPTFFLKEYLYNKSDSGVQTLSSIVFFFLCFLKFFYFFANLHFV